MGNTQNNIPELEERFREPEGWRWHSFVHNGHRLRFGSAFPKDSIPDAVVVCLPGLSEFGEKYFEIARYCLDKNLAFWVLDWRGQGRSDRYFENSQKRHSYGFQNDVEDLQAFIMGYIKHSSVHPDKGRIPLAMLAHSMGANIGLHYIKQHPEVFECAAFSAPLFGMKACEKMPKRLPLPLSFILQLFMPYNYAPGEKNWSPSTRPCDGSDAMSSDPVRVDIHRKWFEADPSLQVGGVTYGWVYQAVKSSAYLANKLFAKGIHTPCLMALAGCETLVNNTKARHVARSLPHCELLEFEDAKHEILMERDEFRNAYLEKFYGLIKENIIDRPKSLKPF
ncbi:MAG: alpha/beta hydrolase [Rhodospirillales bacterium]|nr:alpha/beta hydrolase [Alphaproteobacteria bacterium]USO04796.1 MAG: alpha/beta hydrolase [Rhodospirillales bacterium]